MSRFCNASCTSGISVMLVVLRGVGRVAVGVLGIVGRAARGELGLVDGTETVQPVDNCIKNGKALGEHFTAATEESVYDGNAFRVEPACDACEPVCGRNRFDERTGGGANSGVYRRDRIGEDPAHRARQGVYG